MKTLTIVLCAASICLAIGCEKDYPGREGQTGFDQKIDGPVNAMKAPADESLLADQGKISGEFETEEAPAPVPAPTPPPAASGTPVDQVKAVMTQMAAAAKGGQEAQLPAFFNDADAALIRPLVQIDLKAKGDKFTQAVKTKLRTKLPPQMDGMIKRMAQPRPLNLVGDATKYKFKQVGQTIVATDPSGDELTFAKVGSAWKAKLSDKRKADIMLLKTRLDSANKFLDEAIAGVNDGSISRQNLAAKLQELQKKHTGGPGQPSPLPIPPPPEPGF